MSPPTFDRTGPACGGLRQSLLNPIIAIRHAPQTALPARPLSYRIDFLSHWGHNCAAAEAVIVGTLDQVVSRQLMRGYCCSRWSWPHHFAALNTDVRVVVDETQLHQKLGGPAPRELVLCSATLDAAILPAVTPSWAERCRLRASGGSTEGGPHQAAHHRDRWEKLLLAGRPEEAMELAMHRLRVCDVVSWPWPAITARDPERLLRAVEVPVHPRTLGRAKAGG